jgi:hypothetical protein
MSRRVLESQTDSQAIICDLVLFDEARSGKPMIESGRTVRPVKNGREILDGADKPLPGLDSAGPSAFGATRFAA